MADPATAPTQHDLSPLPAEVRERRANELTAAEKQVLLHRGTEHAFCGNLLDEKRDGTYVCKLCDLPLFSSAHKFDSGTGWPSYHSPYHPEHIRERVDDSHGMRRVEIRCARCDGHLGHVFPDGPEPTGQRYCLNSASMTFIPEGTALPERPA